MGVVLCTPRWGGGGGGGGGWGGMCEAVGLRRVGGLGYEGLSKGLRVGVRNRVWVEGSEG